MRTGLVPLRKIRRLALLSGIGFLAVAGVRPSGTPADIAAEPEPGYAVTEAAIDGAFTASNSAHGLRLRFDGTGAAIAPLDERSGAWSFGIALQAIGRGDHPLALQPIAVTMEGSQVSYAFSDRVSATFENAERGMGIDFALPESFAGLAGIEPLRIELAWTGSMRIEVVGPKAPAVWPGRVGVGPT